MTTHPTHRPTAPQSGGSLREQGKESVPSPGAGASHGAGYRPQIDAPRQLVGATFCSGIGSPELAAPWVDWRLASEIEPFPRAVLQHRFGYSAPEDHNQGGPLLWGDMTEVTPDLLRSRGVPLPDLIVAGTPCQAFSVAGLRKGTEDPRGNLTLAFVEICHAIAAARPDGKLAVLWENVPGVLSDSGNAFGAFLGGLVGGVGPIIPSPRPGNPRSNKYHWRWIKHRRWRDRKGRRKYRKGYWAATWPGEGMVQGPWARAAWAVLDAQYFGVAQRRRRVFVVVDFGNALDPAAVLLEPESLRGHPPARGEAGQDVAGTVSARTEGGGGLGTDFEPGGGLQAFPSTGDISHCLNAGGMGRIDYETETLIACATGDTTHALTGEGFDTSRCSAEGCMKKPHALGFCKSHYSRWKRHGDPLAGRVAEGEPLAFLRKQADLDSDTCVIWPFGLFKSGYPSIYIDRKNRRAHRVMCEWKNGPPAYPSVDAAHSCGNRACVNPNHIRWATRSENMADAVEHGTAPRGERHGAAVLDEGSVAEIVSRLDGGETHQSIADQFGVSRNAITDIAKGKNWAWLTGRGTPVIAFSSKDYGADAETDLAPTLRAGGHHESHANAGVPPAIAFNARQDPDAWLERTGPLDTDGSTQAVATPWAVRRLTETETARLQGYPDDHTKIPWRGRSAEECPAGPQYKAHGNGMAVPVVRWIMDRMRISMEAAQ